MTKQHAIAVGTQPCLHISILMLEGDNYFQRVLISLNMAFVEVSVRMSLNSHLPNVSYQIKLQ
jgi:hypothetical protein